jgi:Putative zinc-binding metallo-peptidase
MDRHYEHGAPADWQSEHVSAYATMHPWEDWAETFAHYLHIQDTLETAEAFGLSRGPDNRSIEALIETWLPLSYGLNQVNRSMGHADLYPFVLAPKVITKLGYIHGRVETTRHASAEHESWAERSRDRRCTPHPGWGSGASRRTDPGWCRGRFELLAKMDADAKNSNHRGDPGSGDDRGCGDLTVPGTRTTLDCLPEDASSLCPVALPLPVGRRARMPVFERKYRERNLRLTSNRGRPHRPLKESPHGPDEPPGRPRIRRSWHVSRFAPVHTQSRSASAALWSACALGPVLEASTEMSQGALMRKPPEGAAPSCVVEGRGLLGGR